MIWLSIVVIGRNEAQQLPALFESLPAGNDIEWIYVDSQSRDDSVAVALKYGAKVFLIRKESIFAPGTGRHVGTKEAAGSWILYLDGDMTLCEEFRSFIGSIKNSEALPPETAGFVGRTRNCYLDDRGTVVGRRDYVVLTEKEMGPAETWGKPVKYHGGAVLYRKEAVINAGNWNPALYQLEEVELSCRIQARGGILRAVNIPMADHSTPYLTRWEQLKLNFLPQFQGKKLYGAGQVVSARLKDASLLQFIKCYPYPFIVFAGLVTALPLYLIWPPLPLLCNLVIAIWIGIKKKWYFYLVYLGNLLQILRGIGHYRNFNPDYRQVEK